MNEFINLNSLKRNKELENAKKELQQIKLLNINAFVLQKMTEKMDDEFKSTIKNSDQLKMHYQEIIKNMDDEKQKEMIGLFIILREQPYL